MAIPVFLDRDGTIIEDKHYLSDAAGVALLPEAAAGLKLLQNNGFKLIVITNQSGIGRSYFTEKQMHAVNLRLCELLHDQNVLITLKHFYHCPHAPEDGCECRKPAPKLALQAARDFNLDLSEGYVIGDKLSDLDLARNLHLTPILVTTGYGAATAAKYPESSAFTAKDLKQAADYIISQNTRQNS